VRSREAQRSFLPVSKSGINRTAIIPDCALARVRSRSRATYSRLAPGRCSDALGGFEMESLSHVIGLSYPSGEVFVELIERCDTELVYEEALRVGRG
jgi:hypothetical protein